MSVARGFTLIELMISIAIVAILLAVAVPSFTEVILQNRMTSYVNEMLASVNYARTEAIKRGLPVRFTAVGGNLAQGWCVHTGVACDGATALRRHEALDNSASTGPFAFVEFDRRGMKSLPASALPGGEVVFGIKPTGCAAGAQKARTITILGTGRAAATRSAC